MAVPFFFGENTVVMLTIYFIFFPQIESAFKKVAWQMSRVIYVAVPSVLPVFFFLY